MSNKKIVIVVQGRFHAFDFARALQKQGVECWVISNYPWWAAKKWGLSKELYHGIWWHGILQRVIARVPTKIQCFLESYMHIWFSKRATNFIQINIKADVICAFSGVAEDLFLSIGKSAEKILWRGSVHIDMQRQLLEEESERCGYKVELPSDWMVAREKREYVLADRIEVLSEFAKKSFEARVNTTVLKFLPGVELNAFKATKSELNERIQRLKSSQKLKVLYVGTISAQKGFYDLKKIFEKIYKKVEVIVVGNIAEDVSLNAGVLKKYGQVSQRVNHYQLKEVYANADILLLPTIQDGFALILAQAFVAGLPFLCTPNCGGPDLIDIAGKGGFILPIRSPEKWMELILKLDANRDMIIDEINSSSGLTELAWENVCSNWLSSFKGNV